MRLHDSNNYVNSNMNSGTQSFTIQASHKAFKILSDSLYKDKITAVIRELSTNAIDAMVDAKNDAPFEVHLPTQLEPHFSVTDKGIGMTHDEILSLYTSYFSSSKTDRDDQIGALGLGSKSPFAYTDSFNVVSIKNGKKGVYNLHLSQGGTPAVMLIEESDSDEHTGTSIEFAVKERDFENFISKASQVYWAFTPNDRPTISGATKRYNELFTQIENGVEILDSNDSWVLYKDFPSHLRTSWDNMAQARMGNILYPISADQLGDNIDSEVRFALRNRLVIEMPLGACDIAPSREELNYDEETVRNLVVQLKKTTQAFMQHMSTKVQGASTAWEALVTFRKLTNNLNNVPENTTVTYQGVEYEMGKSLHAELDGSYVRASIERRRSMYVLSTDDTSKNINVEPKESVRFVRLSRDSQTRGGHNRARIKLLCNSPEVGTVILLNPDVTYSDINKLGNPPIVRFEDLPKPAVASYGSKKAAAVQKVYTYLGGEKQVDPATYRKNQFKAFIVKKGQAYYSVSNGDLSKYDIESIREALNYYFRYGWLNKDNMLVVPFQVWKANKKMFTEANKWMNVGAFVERKVIPELNKIRKVYGEAQRISTLKDKYGHLISALDIFEAVEFSTNSLFASFLDTAKTLADSPANDVDLGKYIRANRHMCSTKVRDRIEKIQSVAKTADTFELSKTYPLLTLLTESWELRRQDGLVERSLDSGSVSRKGQDERSAAEAVVEYIQLIDAKVA